MLRQATVRRLQARPAGRRLAMAGRAEEASRDSRRFRARRQSRGLHLAQLPQVTIQPRGQLSCSRSVPAGRASPLHYNAPTAVGRLAPSSILVTVARGTRVAARGVRRFLLLAQDILGTTLVARNRG